MRVSNGRTLNVMVPDTAEVATGSAPAERALEGTCDRLKQRHRMYAACKSAQLLVLTCNVAQDEAKHTGSL